LPCPLPVLRYGAMDEAERKLIDTLGRRRAWRFVVRFVKRVRGGRAKSRSRLSPENPRRAKPKGGSSGQQAKPLSGRQELWEGSKPRNRGLSGRPGASVAGTPLGKTVCGPFGAETFRIPSERENLRRVNPTSAAGVKKSRHGIEGSKPPRG
jgi:hypothetical protein